MAQDEDVSVMVTIQNHIKTHKKRQILREYRFYWFRLPSTIYTSLAFLVFNAQKNFILLRIKS